MKEQERSYSKSERKALAIVLALRNFRVNLLFDKPFLVYTDHQALETAFRKRNIDGRLTR